MFRQHARFAHSHSRNNNLMLAQGYTLAALQEGMGAVPSVAGVCSLCTALKSIGLQQMHTIAARLYGYSAEPGELFGLADSAFFQDVMILPGHVPQKYVYGFMMVVHNLMLIECYSARAATMARARLSWLSCEQVTGVDGNEHEVYYWCPGVNDTKVKWKAGKVQISKELYCFCYFLRCMCHPGAYCNAIALAIQADGADVTHGVHRELEDRLSEQWYSHLFVTVDPTVETLWADTDELGPEPGVDVLNSLLQKFKEDSLQKPVRSKYTSECLMLAWADHNLANVDPPLTFITANMFRHVYATNLYYAWYNQDATGMDGKPNPFLGMEWHDFVASASEMMGTGTYEFEFTYCAVQCAHHTADDAVEAGGFNNIAMLGAATDGVNQIEDGTAWDEDD